MGNSMGYDWIFRYNHLHVHQKCIWGKLQLVWLYIHHWSSSFITCTRTWAGSFARVGRESISDSLQLSTECVLLSYNLSANSILDNAKKRCAQSKRMHSWCETNAVIDFGNMDLCHKLWISVIWTIEHVFLAADSIFSSVSKILKFITKVKSQRTIIVIFKQSIIYQYWKKYTKVSQQAPPRYQQCNLLSSSGKKGENESNRSQGKEERGQAFEIL